MEREAATTDRGKSENPGEGHGRAYVLGRRCFLAFVALTPLVIGALPPQAGSLALFRAFDPVSLPKVVALLVFSGLSLAALCVSLVRRESELRWHPVLWILVALLGWAGVSALFAASPAVSVWGIYLRNEGLVAIFGYFLVAFLAVQYVRSIGDLRTVMAVAVVSGSLVSAYALLQYVGVDPIEWSQTWRVVSSFGNADMLGDYLVFPFALALGLALSARGGRPRLGWWAAAALLACALLATVTRGAWIGALAAVSCIGLLGWGRLWQASRNRRLVLGGLAVAVVAAVAVAIVLARPGLAGSATTLSSMLVRLSNGRTLIWLTGLRGWLAHPITGWGPDGFMGAFESAVGPDWYATLSSGGVGFGSADNAHNFLVQALVTLGIPGLVLTAWALVRTAIGSRSGLSAAKGRGRLLLVALWGALIGMMVALVFGVTTPEVSVWLWLTVGLLLAPASHRVPAVPRAVLASGAALGVAVALWSGSWLVADVIVGRAMQQEAGPAQVSALESAARLNPLSPRYHWFVGEALVNEALAEQRAGQSRQTVDGTMLRAISAYRMAATADRGDVLVRIALAHVLSGYAADHPESDAAQRAVDVSLEAVSIGPRDAAALVTLARAYQAAGRHDEAEKTARLAREVAPAYAAQTLGSLGLGATTP
jgi:putative inorganic carbon (HCO3(-)) transporter